MHITIHRGTNEIGGTCIEVSDGKTRLLLDLGMPLGNFQEFSAESLPNSLSKFDAVIVSHPHLDHYGLIENISPELPVYIGSLSEKFIKAARLFIGEPPLKNNFKSFDTWKSFQLGDIRITPFPVDHSAADAYSFLIEGSGQKIFYSGDFRAHGRKSVLFEHILQKPPENIDVLLMEGTMLDKENREFPDEKSIENVMLEHLRVQRGASFLISSSQNIDRIVTAYRASKRAGRVFVVDIYTAWILKEISNFSSHIPTIEWDDVRVLAKGVTAARHYTTIKANPEHFDKFISTLYKKGNLITHDDIKKEPKRYLIKNSRTRVLMDICDLETAGVIYSQWKGYMSEEYNPKRCRSFKELEKDPRVSFLYAHTSGHAVLKDLQRFAKAVSPKMLIPVHTEHKERYREYFDNVKLLEDGEEFQI